MRRCIKRGEEEGKVLYECEDGGEVLFVWM